MISYQGSDAVEETLVRRLEVGGSIISDISSRGITIDARHLMTGIGAYTKNLIKNLRALNYGPLHILTRTGYREEIAPYCDQLSVVDVSIYSISEQVAIPFFARRSQVLHVPHYNAPLLYRGRLLLTIHDITHILFADYQKTWKSCIYASPMLRIAARQASHIFTVSEYSKRKLIESMNIKEDNITVVYNGVGSQFSPRDNEQARACIELKYPAVGDYILYVGSLKPHKNIASLIKAYALLCAGKMPEVGLVIVGKGDAVQLELEYLAESLGVRPLFVIGATDGELAEWYRAAEVLVLPSFEEGFGLPIVEAMACGTPVICANAASMPEIAGDAALLFDPYDIEDLCRALIDVLSSADLRHSLRERGLVQAEQFTWRNTAARHIPIYDRFRD